MSSPSHTVRTYKDEPPERAGREHPLSAVEAWLFCSVRFHSPGRKAGLSVPRLAVKHRALPEIQPWLYHAILNP